MFQIQIWPRQFGQDVDMAAVCAALADLMTPDQTLPDGGEARERDIVYVRFGTSSEALRRIHALGYDTDEDEPDPGEEEYVYGDGYDD